ncbi:hypothetical protein QTN25_006708 [Entamoeba marina]
MDSNKNDPSNIIPDNHSTQTSVESSFVIRQENERKSFSTNFSDFDTQWDEIEVIDLIDDVNYLDEISPHTTPPLPSDLFCSNNEENPSAISEFPFNSNVQTNGKSQLSESTVVAPTPNTKCDVINLVSDNSFSECTLQEFLQNNLGHPQTNPQSTLGNASLPLDVDMINDEPNKTSEDESYLEAKEKLKKETTDIINYQLIEEEDVNDYSNSIKETTNQQPINCDNVDEEINVPLNKKSPIIDCDKQSQNEENLGTEKTTIVNTSILSKSQFGNQNDVQEGVISNKSNMETLDNQNHPISGHTIFSSSVDTVNNSGITQQEGCNDQTPTESISIQHTKDISHMELEPEVLTEDAIRNIINNPTNECNLASEVPMIIEQNNDIDEMVQPSDVLFVNNQVGHKKPKRVISIQKEIENVYNQHKKETKPNDKVYKRTTKRVISIQRSCGNL